MSSIDRYPHEGKQRGLSILQGVSYYLSSQWNQYERHSLRHALTIVSNLQNEIIDDMYHISRSKEYGPCWMAVADRIR